MCDNRQEPFTFGRPGPTPSAYHEPGIMLPVSFLLGMLSLIHKNLNKTDIFQYIIYWGVWVVGCVCGVERGRAQHFKKIISLKISTPARPANTNIAPQQYLG